MSRGRGPERVTLVQRLLLYPDGRVHGLTPPVLAAQHVLAELGRVHAAAAGRSHAEALLEETLQHLKDKQRGSKLTCKHDSRLKKKIKTGPKIQFKSL